MAKATQRVNDTTTTTATAQRAFLRASSNPDNYRVFLLTQLMPGVGGAFSTYGSQNTGCGVKFPFLALSQDGRYHSVVFNVPYNSVSQDLTDTVKASVASRQRMVADWLDIAPNSLRSIIKDSIRHSAKNRGPVYAVHDSAPLEALAEKLVGRVVAVPETSNYSSLTPTAFVKVMRVGKFVRDGFDALEEKKIALQAQLDEVLTQQEAERPRKLAEKPKKQRKIEVI